MRAFGADDGKATRTPAGVDETVCSPLPTNATLGVDDGLSGTRIRSRFLAWVTSTEHYWVTLAKREGAQIPVKNDAKACNSAGGPRTTPDTLTAVPLVFIQAHQFPKTES